MVTDVVDGRIEDGGMRKLGGDPLAFVPPCGTAAPREPGVGAGARGQGGLCGPLGGDRE